MSELPLEGIRILDLTRYTPGSYGITLLSDVGAEVIMVEEPTKGNPVRSREPQIDGLSYYSIVRDRNKKSVAINLKESEGRELFLELAETADVVAESFRPGVVDRLGVGYEDVRAVNPDVVYCSISGYGQDGPYADLPGHDINYIGIGGMLALTGEPDGKPVTPGYPMADYVGAMYMSFAIVTALLGRTRHDGGEYIDVSLTDSVVSLAGTYAPEYFAEGTVPRRGETIHSGSHPGYHVYETADGELITLGALEQKFWDGLCEALGAPELVGVRRAELEAMDDEEREEIRSTFDEAFSTRTLDEWLTVLGDNDIPAAPVNEYDEVFEDPHLRERGLFDEVEVGGETVPQLSAPFVTRNMDTREKRPPSRLGEDTASIVRGLGYGADDVAALREAGVIRTDEA